MSLIFSLIFLFSIAIASAAFAADGDFGNTSDEGIGTAENPYLIEDEDDLKAFRDIINGTSDYEGQQDAGAHAKLTQDITLEFDDGESWTPIGDNINRYTGTFDGGGYAIHGLTVNGTNCAGFFGYVGEGGIVKNLTIVGGNVSGDYAVGGIVGRNDGTVENCGSLAGSHKYNYAYNSSGGVVTTDSSTNVGTFTSDEKDRIAVTLFASIEDDEIATVGGETTINLSILPGNLADVVEAGGLAINEDSGLIDIDLGEISNGTFTVTAKGTPGTAEISVTLYVYDYDSDKYTDDVALSLSIPVAVGKKEITSITISPSSLNLAVGKTHTLTVSYDPEDTALRKVEWTSSNTDIATVDENGMVTGVSVGEVTITATSTENEYINDSCEVTVAEAPETPGDEDTSDDNDDSGSTGGGGCNAGIGALALLALIPLALRRKR